MSSYGNHLSGIVEPVQRSKLLLCNMDVGEIENLRSQKKELEEFVATLEASSKGFQDEERRMLIEAANRRKEWEEIIKTAQKEKEKRREIIGRIDQKKKKLKLMEKEDGMDVAMAKLIDDTANCKIQRFLNAIKIKNLLVEAIGHRRGFIGKRMASIEFDAQIKELETNLKQHERFALDASKHFDSCRKEAENCRQQLADFKSHAESIAPITLELKEPFLEEKWLPTLRNLVAQINETFSRNFKEMAVAGEVLLDEHDMDFDQFGILIKVKFRPTGQLQVLSAHHQSGGERSVLG